MNAAEFLKFLENTTAESDSEIENMIDALKGIGKMRADQFGFSELEEYYKSLADGIMPDDLSDLQMEALPRDFRDYHTWYIREHIYKHIKNNLEDDLKSIMRDVPIAVLPISSLNAHIILAPSQEPIIVVNRGLLHIISYYMESQYAVNSIVLNDGLQEATKHLVVSYAFIINYVLKQGTVSFPTNLVKGSFDRYGLFMLISIAVEAFVICHEIGHFYLGHLQDGKTRNVTFKIGDQERMIDAIALSWSQEIEADIFGWQLYRKIFRFLPLFENRGSNDHELLAGCLYFFVLLTIIEKNVPDIPDRRTHPPAILRLAALLKYVKTSENVDDRDGLAAEIEKKIKLAASVPDQQTLLEFFIEDYTSQAQNPPANASQE